MGVLRTGHPTESRRFEMNQVSVVMMTAKEAQSCRDRIKVGIQSVREDLLSLYEQEGWKALGYGSWRECAKEEFGYSQSHGYRLLDAARVERDISPIGEKVHLPESQARPLTKLKSEERREVWAEVSKEPVTAKRVKKVIDVRQRLQKAIRGTPMRPSAVQVLANYHKLQGEEAFQKILELVATGEYDTPQKAYAAYKRISQGDSPPVKVAPSRKPCPTCGCTCRIPRFEKRST